MLKKCIFVSLFLALVFAKTLPFKYVSSSKDTASIVTSLASNMPLRNGSIKERLEMWKGTLFLMKDNFFIGIGPGEFEFDFIPFQKRYTESQMTENVIFNTPHNDFLRIAAEYGVPFLVICMSIFLSMFKKNTKKDIDKNDYYIKILTLFFAVEGFFQFPLLNTYSFFYIILIISYYIYKSYETIQFNFNVTRRLCFLLLTIMLLILGSMKLVSSYLETNYKNYDQINIACNIFPSNWRACLTKAQFDIRRGNFNEAIKTVHEVLDESPYNFPALHVASLLYWEIGNKRKSCMFSKRYIELIDSEKNLLFIFHNENCTSI